MHWGVRKKEVPASIKKLQIKVDASKSKADKTYSPKDTILAGAILAISAGSKALTKRDINRAVESYKNEHPNSKMSNTGISRMLEIKDAGG